MMTEYKTLPAKLAFMATAVLWPALCGRESCTCVTHITEDHGAHTRRTGSSTQAEAGKQVSGQLMALRNTLLSV